MKKFLVLPILLIAGCGVQTQYQYPALSIDYSEYPSWSVFGVAESVGLINGEKGKYGPIEEKHQVDIVLNLADYDTCIADYASGATDAVCITNIDIIPSAINRASVGIFPTSTSVGADAAIFAKDTKTIYGLEKSVSQFVWEEVLKKKGLDPKDYDFKNMDPEAAAKAMQTKQDGIDAIMVWNPFVMQTLRTVPNSKVFLDSSDIPGYVIDGVIIGKTVVEKPEGKRFALALLETFYKVNELINDPSTRENTLVSLGEKFSSLGVSDMEIVVQQTKFYDSPESALTVYNKGHLETVMPAAVDFAKRHGLIDTAPTIGFNDPNAQLNFTTEFIDQLVVEPKKAILLEKN